jgi:hypothetical protein
MLLVGAAGAQLLPPAAAHASTGVCVVNQDACAHVSANDLLNVLKMPAGAQLPQPAGKQAPTATHASIKDVPFMGLIDSSACKQGRMFTAEHYRCVI